MPDTCEAIASKTFATDNFSKRCAHESIICTDRVRMLCGDSNCCSFNMLCGATIVIVKDTFFVIARQKCVIILNDVVANMLCEVTFVIVT